MQRISIEVDSSVPAEQVFARLADALTWPDWSPIGRAEIERPARDGGQGVGEIRRFITGRVTSREEVVTFDPTHRFAYRLLSGLPLEDYQARITLTPNGSGCHIAWLSTFRGRWPGAGPFYRLVLGRFIRRLLQGLAAERT
jgi:hypothetical protein